jgi:hypothetical protein
MHLESQNDKLFETEGQYTILQRSRVFILIATKHHIDNSEIQNDWLDVTKSDYFFATSNQLGAACKV